MRCAYSNWVPDTQLENNLFKLLLAYSDQWASRPLWRCRSPPALTYRMLPPRRGSFCLRSLIITFKRISPYLQLAGIWVRHPEVNQTSYYISSNQACNCAENAYPPFDLNNWIEKGHDVYLIGVQVGIHLLNYVR